MDVVFASVLKLLEAASKVPIARTSLSIDIAFNDTKLRSCARHKVQCIGQVEAVQGV